MEVGRFRLGAFIGRGASGDVYDGTDTATGAQAAAHHPMHLLWHRPASTPSGQHPLRWPPPLPPSPLPPRLPSPAGEWVAIKWVDCRRFRSILELEAVQEEIALLSSLRHRYIVRLLAVHLTPSHIHFAMEHAGGGTLDQLRRGKVGWAGWAGGRMGCWMHIRLYSAIFGNSSDTSFHVLMQQVPIRMHAVQEGGRLEEGEALHIFLQIFQALEYCHRRCVGALLCHICCPCCADLLPPAADAAPRFPATPPRLPHVPLRLPATPPLPCGSAPGPEAGEHPAGWAGGCQGGRLW